MSVGTILKVREDAAIIVFRYEDHYVTGATSHRGLGSETVSGAMLLGGSAPSLMFTSLDKRLESAQAAVPASRRVPQYGGI